MSPSEIPLAIPVENVRSHPNYKPCGGGGGIVVFTYLNVSDSTHSRQDSVIDGIKVEKERERGVS